jgi:multidrug efflux pump subunit AcrB
MHEISGAIIAITLMQLYPVAFMSGPVGIFYRQFSITIHRYYFVWYMALTLHCKAYANDVKQSWYREKRKVLKF